MGRRPRVQNISLSPVRDQSVRFGERENGSELLKRNGDRKSRVSVSFTHAGWLIAVRHSNPRDTFAMVVAFSSVARILGECSIIHFPPALFSFSFFISFVLLKWKLARAH